MLDRLLFEHCRLSAIKAVLDEDEEFLLRRIQRWYSHYFHTPLHEVVELDEEFVLQAKFEHEFDELSLEDKREQISELLLTPEELAERQMRADAEAAERILFQKIVNAKAEEEKKAQAALPKQPLSVKPQLVRERPLRSQNVEPDLQGNRGDGKLLTKEQIPEDTTIVFMTEADMLREMESDGGMFPKGKS